MQGAIIMAKLFETPIYALLFSVSFSLFNKTEKIKMKTDFNY